MKTILLRSPASTISGYGVHSRQVARWLFNVAAEKFPLDITTDLLRWGNTHWITDIYSDNGLIGDLIQASENVKKFYDVTIQLCLPNEWNTTQGRFNIGITAGVETDVCNPQWINNVNQMDLVIVPSEFTKQTFLNTSKCETPIIVVPESYPDILKVPSEDELELDLKTDFNFLMIGQITGNNNHNDRKNIPYTLKWFLEAFKGRKDVGMIVKTNLTCNTHLDRTVTTNLFNKLVTELGVSENDPSIYLLHGSMKDEELNKLYRHPKVKAYVNLSHGEGFNLTALEAGVCGLPIIATNWSAHTEFLSLGKWLKVESALDTIHPSRVDNQIFMQNAKWAMPSENEAKKRMQKFHDAPQIPREWAKDLSTKLIENYSFESISKKYSQVLDNIIK